MGEGEGGGGEREKGEVEKRKAKETEKKRDLGGGGKVSPRRGGVSYLFECVVVARDKKRDPRNRCGGRPSLSRRHRLIRKSWGKGVEKGGWEEGRGDARVCTHVRAEAR